MAVGTNGPPVLDGSAYVFPEKTLKQLRESLIKRLGFAAQLATPPPGLEILLNDFLEDAHTQLYQRYPILRQERWWTVDVTQGNRHYDTPQENARTGALTDIAFNDTDPDTITRSTGSFVTDGFASGDVIYVEGSTSNDGLYTVDTVAATTLTLDSSDTLTAEAAGDTVQIKASNYINLDLREITYIGILDDTKWNDMIPGIDPLLFNIDGQQRPTHYEIREYIEIFPEPDKAYSLYIKGRTGLQPFTQDDHTTSVDPHPVFLQALAQSKAHYGQADANIYFQQLEAFLGNLNASAFSTKRYIPNPDYGLVPLPKPKVTFPRP